jgi:hypothetical protein
MSLWGCPISTIEEFVASICDQTELSASFRKTVQSKLALKQQFAAMQSAKKMLKKTRRRSRAASLLLTPQKD